MRDDGRPRGGASVVRAAVQAPAFSIPHRCTRIIATIPARVAAGNLGHAPQVRVKRFHFIRNCTGFCTASRSPVIVCFRDLQVVLRRYDRRAFGPTISTEPMNNASHRKVEERFHLAFSSDDLPGRVEARDHVEQRRRNLVLT